MNVIGKSRFTREFLTGAVLFCEASGNVQWRNMDAFLNTKESLDDYALFQYLVKHIRSSLVVSVANENEYYMESTALEEERRLQIYYFEAYLRSCDFIKYDSCRSQILEDGLLDVQSFPALYEIDISTLLSRHIFELEELESIYELYAYRKSLAKCEFIKWDSDFLEVYKRLKYEEKWSELSDHVLNIALSQHFYLLQKLKNDEKATRGPVANSKILECLGNDLLEVVDREFCAELLKFDNKCWERRMKLYHQHMEFKYLVTKCAVESRALKIEYLPKEYQLRTELKPKTLIPELYQLKYQAKTQSTRWVLEKFCKLRHRMGGKSWGGITQRWSGLIIGAGLLTAFGIGKQKA